MNQLQAQKASAQTDLAARLVRTANHQIGAAVSQTRTDLVLLAIACILAATAFAAALVATFIYLAALTSPLSAALMVAGGSLGLAGLVAIWLLLRRARARREQRLKTASRALAASGVAAALPHLAHAKSPLSWVALGGAAYLLARLLPEEIER